MATVNDGASTFGSDVRSGTKDSAVNLDPRTEPSTDETSGEQISMEHNKFQLILQDIKNKLHDEKLTGFQVLINSLGDAFNSELEEAIKKKNTDNSLETGLRKTRSEVFDEKAEKKNGKLEKIMSDLQEAKSARKSLEEAYQSLQDADRQKANDLRKMSNEHKLEIARICRESHQEVRKLMDEIRSKDRVIVHLEKELGYKSRSNKRSDSPNDLSSEIVSVDGDRYQMRIADLSRKLRRMEDHCQTLSDEKSELTKRIRDLERKVGPAQEKTRRYLHKNMDLTAVNRSLEDKLKHQGDENTRMKNQLEDIKRRMESMMTSLAQEKQERVSSKELNRKLEVAQREISDLQKGVDLFKKECAEKDRRIELLKHFQKQAREAKVNSKEIEERRRLSSENRRLTEKFRALETERRRCEERLRESQEQNEILEFRVLELEELLEKLEQNHYDDDCPCGGLQQEEDMKLSIMDILNIDITELLVQLDQIKHRLTSALKREEKTTLLKAKAMLDIADKRLKSSQTTEHALRDRIDALEAEKADLLSHATGVSPECVLEYEENRGKLLEAEKRLSDLEKENKILQDRNNAQLYQSEIEKKRLKSAQDEADELKKKIQSLHEGRDNEEAVMKEMGRFKDKQQKIAELEEKLKSVEFENVTLKERLEKTDGPGCKDLTVLMNMKKLKDRISEVESENDLLKNSELGEVVMELKSTKEQISELEWEKEKLEVEVDVLKKRNQELENSQAEISKNYSDLKMDLKLTKNDVDKMKENFQRDNQEHGEGDPGDLSRDNERLRAELFMSKQEITQLDKELNNLEDSFVKINDENQILLKEVEKMKGLKDDIAHLKTGMNAKEYEITELKKTLDRQKDDLAKARKAYVAASVQADDLKKQVDKLEKEKTDVEKERDEWKEKNNKLVAEKEELEKEKEEWKSEKDMLNEKGKGRKKLLREGRIGDEIVKEEVAGNLEAWPGGLSDSGLPEEVEITSEGAGQSERMSPEQLYAEERAQLDKQIDGLKNDKAELEKDIEVLKDNEAHLKSNLESLEKENKDKDNRLAELEKDLNVRDDELKQMHKDMLENSLHNAEMEKEKNRLNEKLNDLQKDIDDVTNQRRALDDKCQSLEVKNMDLTHLVSTAEDNEAKMKNKIENLENEIEKLKASENELKSEMEDVKYESYDKIGNLKEEIERLKKNEERLSESLNEAEQTELELRERLDFLENPDSDINRQVSQLKEQNNDLNEKLDDLEDKLQASNELLDENEKKYEEEVKTLEDENDQLDNEVKTLKQRITNLESELDKLDEELSNSKDKNEQLNDALQKAQKRAADLDRATNDNDGVINDLNNQIEEKDQKISDLKEQLEEKDSVIEKQNAEIMEKDKLLNEQLDPNSELVTLKQENESDKKRISDLQDKVDVLMNSEDRLLDQIRDLETKLHGSKESSPHSSVNKSPSDELNNDGIRNRSASNDDNEEKIRELESLVDELQTRQRTLNDRIEELEKSEQNLMQELALSQLDSVASDSDVNRTDSDEIVKASAVNVTEAAVDDVPGAADNAVSGNPVLLHVQVRNTDVLDGLKSGAKPSPATKGDLDDLSHAELIDRVHKLQQNRINDAKRIRELEKTLERVQNGELLEDLMGKNQSKSPSMAGDDVIDAIENHDNESGYYGDQNLPNHLHDEHDEELTKLKESEEKLKNELAAARREQEDSELLARISKMKKSEAELNAKLSTYDSQDVESLSRRLSDVSDDELRRKVIDLERMEKQLTDQISEMEVEQESMNEMARKDKDVIHELNVESREHQSVIVNLRDQVSRMEASEVDLTGQIDQLQTEVEDLEDQLNRVKRSEKRFKDEVRLLTEKEAESNKKSVELEDEITDISSREAKLKSQLKQLENENQQLTERVEKLQERIYDLESNEIIDKQKIRELEKRTRKLAADLANVVDRATSPEDLRTLNDNLQRKVSALEEEKAGLNYEVTDLSREIEQLEKDVALLQNNEQALKQQLEYFENNQRKFQKKTRDLEMAKLDLMGQMDEMEREARRPVSPMPNRRLGGKDAEIETLQEELAASQHKVKQLQNTVKTLKEQNLDPDADTVTIPHVELLHLEHQSEKLRAAEHKLHQAEKTNASLMDSLKKIRSGKSGDDDHDLEVRDLQNQIDYLNTLLKEKQAARFAGELIVDSDVKDGDLVTIRRTGRKQEVGVQSENSEPILNGPAISNNSGPSSHGEETIRPEAAKRDRSAPKDFSDFALDGLTDALKPLNSDSRRSSFHLPDSDKEVDEELLSPTHQSRDNTLPDFDLLDHPEKYQKKSPSRDASPKPSSRTQSRSPDPARRSSRQGRDPSGRPVPGDRDSDRRSSRPEIGPSGRPSPGDRDPDTRSSRTDSAGRPNNRDPSPNHGTGSWSPESARNHSRPDSDASTRPVPSDRDSSRRSAHPDRDPSPRPRDENSSKSRGHSDSSPRSRRSDPSRSDDQNRPETARTGSSAPPGDETVAPSPMSSPSKRRRHKNRDYDGDSDSSMDEEPIAGVNRRESQLFDVPHQLAETLAEPGQKSKSRVIKEPQPESEDLSVSMHLSDESQPNSPRRDRVQRTANRPHEIEEEIAPSRSTGNLYSPEDVNGEREHSDEMHDAVPEARVNVPNRRRRPSDTSADDSGIHSNFHSQGPDDYDRSSTPSRGSGLYEPSQGVPHLSPWLTHQLVDQKSSGTNTDFYKHRAETQEWPVGPLRHIATDTDEMSREQSDEIKRLKQIIADLQCELKVKQRELETARFVQKGLEEKVRGAEDSFTWKAKVKERDRDLSNKDRLLRNVMDENTALLEEIQDRQRQISLLQAEVDNLDAVCKAKDVEGNVDTINRLKEELNKAQMSLSDVISEKEELDVDNKALKHQVEQKNKDIKDKSEKVDELSRELKRATSSMKEAEQQKMEMEGKFRSAQIELDKLSGADTKLHNIRDEYADLKNKNVEMEDSLHQLHRDKAERDQLSQVVDDLKKQIKDYEELKSEKADLDQKVNTLQKLLDNKLDECETNKSKLEKSVAPLRAKAMRLGNKCREKDDMIRRLVQEINKAGAADSPVVKEAELMKQTMPQEEYNRPLSPVPLPTVEDDVIKPAAAGETHAAMMGAPNGDMYHNQPDSDIIPTRLAKTETAPDQSRLPLPMDHLPPMNAQAPRATKPSPGGGFQAYDPRPHQNDRRSPHLSTSSLNGSDLLHNVPLPSDGLTEILPTTVIRSENKGSSLGLDRSPDNRQKSRSMDRRKPTARGQPHPPSDFHIARILSDRNVMVAWQPPHVDELDRSNGVQVVGYKISVDDIEKHKVSSPHLSKALIGRLDLHRPHKITIQAVGPQGEASAPVHTYFEDVVSDTRGSNSDLGSIYMDDDTSSLTSTNVYKNNDPKTFVAIYDYDPASQSPNPFPNSELAFRTGDLIMTYGRVRQDGFYNAKIRGKKGLVPASFIEAVPVNKKPKRHSSRPGSSNSLNVLHHPTM